MSKNSFTKNFNSCVAGFPIASVAAHMILHEGLIKDIGKIALPAAALAGLYNYGDDAAEWIGDHINKDVGDKLGDWHRAGKEWTQDTWLGQKAGLGGDEAADRRYYTGQYNTNMAYAANDYNNRMAALNNQRVNGDASGRMMTDEEYQKQKAQIDQDFAARKSRAGNLAYNDTIAHAQQNGRSVPAWKPDERNGFFDQNSKASGGDLHQAERDSGIAQHNAAVERNPGEGYVSPNMQAKQPLTAQSIDQQRAEYEKQKDQFNASMNRAGQAKSRFLDDKTHREGILQTATQGAADQIRTATNDFAEYGKQRDQFNTSMNRAGQAKSAFLANQAERKISGDMTGDGTYVPNAGSFVKPMSASFDSLNKDFGISPSVNIGSGMKLRTDNPEMMNGGQVAYGNNPFGPKQPQAPAAQPVPAQPADQTQAPPSQPAPAQPVQQTPVATPDPNAQQTQTLKAPDPVLTSTNERVPAGQPAPAAQQQQAPAPQRDVAARPQTPSYIPPAQPSSGQSAFDIAKNAAMHAGINTAIQTGMRRMMTPKPQAKPLPPR